LECWKIEGRPILKNVQNAKEKKHFISLHCGISFHYIVAVSPPLFLNLSLYVILYIPEVPAFKKRAQVFGR